MTIGDRIEARRVELGIKSQSALARRVGMRQSTLNGLIRKPYRWSPYLTKIARELQTTVEYLSGETDDPDDNAPPAPAPPAIQQVMMPVSLPSENALADMFEGLLMTLHQFQPILGWNLDELGRELAQLLPTGLSQLQGRLIELPQPPRLRSDQSSEPTDEAQPSGDRELQR